MISISKTCVSFKIDILIHNWTSKKICSIRYTQDLDFLFWKSRKWLYLRPQNRTRSRPPKAADFFGCFFRLLYNHFLDFQNNTYRYWVYLMEHIFFEAQLCIKISIFKEKHVFDILIILCLMTSLLMDHTEYSWQFIYMTWNVRNFPEGPYTTFSGRQEYLWRSLQQRALEF